MVRRRISHKLKKLKKKEEKKKTEQDEQFYEWGRGWVYPVIFIVKNFFQKVLTMQELINDLLSTQPSTVWPLAGTCWLQLSVMDCVRIMRCFAWLQTVLHTHVNTDAHTKKCSTRKSTHILVHVYFFIIIQYVFFLGNPPIAEVVESGVVPLFVQFLGRDYQRTQQVTSILIQGNTIYTIVWSSLSFVGYVPTLPQALY